MNIWIYIDGMQKGPFTEVEISEMGLDPSTPVWAEGMEKWQPASEVDFMAPLLGLHKPESSGNTADEAPASERVAEVIESSPEPASQAQHSAAAAVAPLDEPCPPTYLGWSIVLLICCCSPVSLGAVVASICVSSLYNRRNLKGAKRASEVAAWLVMISIALGFLPAMFMSAFK